MTLALHGKSRTRQLVLALGALGAIVGGMAVALLAAPLLGGGGGTAHADASDFTISKSDGVLSGGFVVWTVTFTSNSDTSETIQFSDTYQPGGTMTEIAGFSGPGISCFSSPALQLHCNVEVGAHANTVIQISTNVPQDQCEPQTVTNTAAGFLGVESIDGDVGTYIHPGNPNLCNGQLHGVFELCKEWTAQGPIAANRDFTFSVSDTFEVQQVTIPNVEEGGPPSCVLVETVFGDVVVTEVVPAGFDTPAWLLDDEFQETGAQADFFMDPPFCRQRIETLVETLVEAQVEALVAPACTITFVNEDNDQPPESPTPYVPGCINCRTPFVPTNTPVPPTAIPSNTPVPPTATIPSATQSTGLTDEQRTQTAVAGAKTAAALITPKPPATGSTPGGTSEGTNLLLVLVGLAMAAGGFGLVARRRQ